MSRNNSVRFTVDGIEDIVRELRKLEPELRLRQARFAMRQITEKMYDTAISKVPVGETGNLANSLTKSVRVAGKHSIVAFVVAKRGGSKKGYHSNLIEFGHDLVAGKYIQKTIKFIPPQPFLRPALYENETQYEEIAAKAVEKTLNRLAKRGKL